MEVGKLKQDELKKIAEHMARPGEFGDLWCIAQRNRIVRINDGPYLNLLALTMSELMDIQDRLLDEGYLENGDYDEVAFVQEWKLPTR